VPELPEVETVRRGLEPAMVGARLVGIDQRRPDLRFLFRRISQDALPGDGLKRSEKSEISSRRSRRRPGPRHASRHVGSFRIEALTRGAPPGAADHAAAKNAAHDHVAFDLSTGARIIYNDPRRSATCF